MCITHSGRCLLGHEDRFPDKMYFDAGGLVEAGDDIEHAVRREIEEEAGIEVGEVRVCCESALAVPAFADDWLLGRSADRAIEPDKTGDFRCTLVHP